MCVMIPPNHKIICRKRKGDYIDTTTLIEGLLCRFSRLVLKHWLFFWNFSLKPWAPWPWRGIDLDGPNLEGDERVLDRYNQGKGKC